MHFADDAGVHHLFGFEKQVEAAALRAHLHNAFGAPHGLDNPEAFLDLVRHGLFDIHVLARFHGIDDHGRVPVIGRRHHHRVERFVVEQLLIMIERLGASGCRFDPGGEIRFVDIAHRRYLSADLLELGGEKAPASAGPDEPGANPVIGAHHALGGCGGCGSKEVSAFHNGESPL